MWPLGIEGWVESCCSDGQHRPSNTWIDFWRL